MILCCQKKEKTINTTTMCESIGTGDCAQSQVLSIISVTSEKEEEEREREEEGEGGWGAISLRVGNLMPRS